MPSRSRSPEDYQSRSRGRSQDSRPRSKTRSLSRRRSPSRESRSPVPRHNGRYRDSRSRSLTRSRSRSRDDIVRSPSRGRSRSRSESPLRSTKIVVERLTKNVTEEHLREIFGAYGTIHDMDVPLSRQFGTNRGAAYILYANESDAESAIAHMHEAQLDGATISSCNAESSRPHPRRLTAVPTLTLDFLLPDVVPEVLLVVEWEAHAVEVDEEEDDSDEEARHRRQIPTARGRFQGLGRGHPLRQQEQEDIIKDSTAVEGSQRQGRKIQR
ncbi:RNA-binding protein with serine-rich domain 1-A [Cytospora mali]|uniref:RNA-binding protein with serine-rich domain 1-A n=1 Tax=Cytospora mali TaxID=578113 RepID=A0A194V4S8_CYTMA|nr:RNA-binding protein with serine-rich domain 1-A [Valsa mali var. pyri (nom. inval.)]